VDRSSEVTLWYGDVLIGRVMDVFLSDMTWFGNLERVVHRCDGELAHRLGSFIDFCEDWNERTLKHPADAPDAAEFDQYSDVLKSGLWIVRNSAGESVRIAEAPVFFHGGGISWRTDDLTVV